MQQKQAPTFAAACALAAAAVSLALAGCPLGSQTENQSPSPPAAPGGVAVADDEQSVAKGSPIPADEAAGLGEDSDKTASREEGKKGSSPLSRGVQFLISKQSEDGGFKSESYGALRDGAATTALVLYAMSHVPEPLRQPHHQRLQKAYEFLRPGIQKKHAVANPDGSLDYPTYGSAMTLMAIDRLKLKVPDDERQTLTRWVIDAQLTERHDVSLDSDQYGGWDLEAVSGAKGEILTGSNISITSFCLEALSKSMNRDAPAAVRRARPWVTGCQNKDGGFVFHPRRTHPGNKALWGDDAQQEAFSYGSPTCDGLRCLMYCGFKRDDPAVQAAAGWLEKHPSVKYVPGFEKKAKELGWREGLRFYYYFTQAKAVKFLPVAQAKRRRAELLKVVAEQQHRDGSWKNEQPRMFEDDLLIATSLAVVALGELAGDSGKQ